MKNNFLKPGLHVNIAVLSLSLLVKLITCCFLAGRGEDCGTGEGVSIGLFVPDPEDPASDVVASDG